MISIKEIAKIAGVDVSTVSSALNDSPRVKPETKEKIKQLAFEHVRKQAGGSLRVHEYKYIYEINT